MKSMTGYAALDAPGRRWELRSVNARGLDLRLRLPEVPGLEPLVRGALASVAQRGNVTLSLRLGEADAMLPSLDEAALARALDAVAAVQEAASSRDIALTADRATDLMALRGVFDARDAGPGLTPEEAKADLARLIAEFDADRAREGAGLHALLTAQVDAIAAVVAQATDLAPVRAAHQRETFEAALARLGTAADDAKLTTEIAALAIKSDITEELDRLRLHIDAARALLAEAAPVGRRLDFLTQEFNREANTLCAKAGMAAMTALGLELKAGIDRLREQVQNVE